MTLTHSLVLPSSTDYQSFIQQKSKNLTDFGFDVTDDRISPALFPFQREITKWGIRKGKCAYFAGTGLGKTVLQAEFARLVYASDPNNSVIIVAPLGVTAQTVVEAKKLLDLDINICRERSDLKSGINITNYERLEKFEPDDFQATILDESSIIKGYDSKFRKFLNWFSANHKFKLACSATPAPNDYLELLNHAEWLDVMSTKEAIALFFIQDGNSSHNYRLKKHARSDFWKWVSSWALAIEYPSDINPSFDDSGYVLPPLQVHESIIKATGEPQEGYLFHQNAATISDQRQIRRQTLDERVRIAKEIIEGLPSDAPVLIWCEYNIESESLVKALSEYGAKEVQGKEKPEIKEKTLNAFSNGELRILITKPTIAGFGLNWQHCNNMIFLGVSHSMEQTYQAIRRCWRFGQSKPVQVHFIRSELDGRIAANLASKEKEYKAMMSQLVHLIKENSERGGLVIERVELSYNPTQKMILPAWLS